jgi:hypothetical protein
MAETHECRHPSCTVVIPWDQFACRPHWRSLPGAIKRKIVIAWGSQDLDAHIKAGQEAEQWWNEHRTRG